MKLAVFAKKRQVTDENGRQKIQITGGGTVVTVAIPDSAAEKQ